jgi:hypothetical protein
VNIIKTTMAGNSRSAPTRSSAPPVAAASTRKRRQPNEGGGQSKKSTRDRSKGKVPNRRRVRDLYNTPPSVLITGTAPASTAGFNWIDGPTPLRLVSLKDIQGVRGVPRYLDYGSNAGQQWGSSVAETDSVAGESLISFSFSLQPVDPMETRHSPIAWLIASLTQGFLFP